MMMVVGAGKIGRGFITPLIRASGMEAVLLDKDLGLVESLRRYANYPLTIVRPGGIGTEWIDGYTALHTSETDSILQAVMRVGLILVSVGVDNVSDVGEILAPALLARAECSANMPLHVVACENSIGAAAQLRDAVYAHLGENAGKLTGRVAFVSACVGKTVPLPPQRLLDMHPLSLLVDGYEELPIDQNDILAPFPALKGARLYKDFDYCIRRKLFIHNMGHAVAAYAGALLGYQELTPAMGDRRIYSLTRAAMNESARALKTAYPFAEGLQEYIEGLLALFANADMGDTLSRIAKDPLRKTAREDRLAGALLFCNAQGVDAPHITAGLAAAILYSAPEDESAVAMRRRIDNEGAKAFLTEHAGLPPALAGAVLSAYTALHLYSARDANGAVL